MAAYRQIDMEARPIVAGKEGITAHGIVIWSARYSALENPAPARRQETGRAKLFERFRVQTVQVSSPSVSFARVWTIGIHEEGHRSVVMRCCAAGADFHDNSVVLIAFTVVMTSYPGS